MSEKSHVSYSKEVRARAKSEGKGLVTFSVKFPNGTLFEIQGPADPAECKFAQWAGVLFARPDVRPMPDLEQLVREKVEGQPS